MSFEPTIKPLDAPLPQEPEGPPPHGGREQPCGPEEAEGRAAFADFELDLQHGLLFRNGRRVPLRNQAARVLRLLVVRAPRLVGREEIRHLLWGRDTFICFEQGAADCLREIRAALGDSAGAPRFVETMPRRGYRFLAEVRFVHGSKKPAASEGETAAAAPSGEERGEPLRPAFSRSRPGVLAVALAAALLGLVLGGRPSGPVEPLRIAVAPLSPADEGVSEALALALTEELALQLGRLGGLDLEVTRGRERAHFVLEGRLRRGGDRLHLHARLVRTGDGGQAWGKSYERPWGSALALQGELAATVARAVSDRLARGADSQVDREREAPPLAREKLLLARTAWARRRPDDLVRARDFAREAVSLAPNHAPGHALLAQVEVTLADYSSRERRLHLERARVAADRALELDADLAAGHTARGVAGLLGAGGWRWADTEASLRRAIALNPSDARARLWLSSTLRFTGRHAEALAEARSAVDLDPLDPAVGLGLANALYYGGNLLASLAQYERVADADPLFRPALFGMARAALRLGRLSEAAHAIDRWRLSSPVDPYFAGGAVDLLVRLGREREAREALGLLSRHPEFPYERALGEMAFGRKAEALFALEEALSQGDPCLRLAGIDERLDPLRGHPRFERVLSEVGLLAAARGDVLRVAPPSS